MKFSIIVPVYNTEKYLKECLDSLINQTYRDFEIILVDDGSTDSSGDICDMYAEQNPDKVKVIHQKNEKQLKARLNGIKKASGAYCIFADADDLLEPNCLEIINKRLEEFSLPDVLIYEYSIFDDSDSLIRYPKRMLPYGKLLIHEEKKVLYERMIVSNDLNSMWTKAVSTELLKTDNTQYDSFFKYPMAEDLLESLFLITNADSVAVCDDILYRYRYNPTGVSHLISVNMIEKNNSIHVYYEIKNYMKLWHMDTPEYHKKLDANWLSQAMYTFDRFYMSAYDRQSRQFVLDYDWKSYVAPESLKTYNENEYLSDNSKKMWRMILCSDFSEIKKYFLKKKIYTSLKRIKRKLRK